MSRYSYKHFKYDTTIMQTVTVENIIEALEMGRKYRCLKEVIDFLINQRVMALSKCDRRKANSTDRKIQRLKELGYKIPKEVLDGILFEWC